ncbi:MAG: NAD-dependent malic enzyme [Syntrophobacteraceae bacterium]
MYHIAYEDGDIVIRFDEDLVDQQALSQFLGHVSFKAALRGSPFPDVAESARQQDLLSRLPQGGALLRDPNLNKGTAFTERERDLLGIRGLLPPRVHSIEDQVRRVVWNLQRKPNDLEKYIFLISLQDRNKTLFYRVLLENIDELMPIVYTPTVGQACMEYGHIFRRPRGIFITANDRGRVATLLRNWPQQDIRIIVVTDGERILGLGDLGADGMGIPVGKLALYTACAGVHPGVSLPVTIDVGTENETLLNDPLYIGLRQRRVRGELYDELVEEFVLAVQQVFPRALIQFEDFANRNAFRFLQRYRNRVCCFNDDIQGTAAIALSGLYSGLRVTGGTLTEQRVLFLGAGEAGIGTGELIVAAMVAEGASIEAARKGCWFVDSKGLVVESRTDLKSHKLQFAHAHEPVADLLGAVEAIRPTALIGVSGKGGMFTRQVLEAMARHNERPMVFALSNPTSNSECTAEEAYAFTDGRALFASGSPFPPATYKGRTHVPAQGNNVYIFPGVGLGAIASAAWHIPDDLFLAAARVVARQVTEEDLAEGRIYPPLRKIREVSFSIAVAVAEAVFDQKLAGRPRPDDIAAHVRSMMFEPGYPEYV